MADFYHFFGLKDKENRFLMRLVNPFAFDVVSAAVALSGLFSTHGSCPAINDVTWRPWKAGKTIYQFWHVTPNKLGLIKSANPSITLDGVPYIGLPIWLLSLDDYTRIYSNARFVGEFTPADYQWRDENGAKVDFVMTDFVPTNIGELDAVNMTGLFYNIYPSVYDWNVIKPWMEAGNIFIDANPGALANKPFVFSSRPFNIGDYVTCVVNEPETEPIFNKPATYTYAGYVGDFRNVVPPGGWGQRNLIEATIAGTAYPIILELNHIASGGKYIGIGCVAKYPDRQSCIMPAWWYAIMALQYPMMKLAGVSAYYTE